jgi:hypothetical protein
MCVSKAWGTSSVGAHEYRYTVTDVSGRNCYLCLRTIPYLLEMAGFRIEAVQWMGAVNGMPSTKTKRYVVVARKHA